MSYKIMVLGESCKDIFQYGTVSRICPEAPCPVFCPTYQTENEGMAGNLVANLKALDETLQIDFVTNLHKGTKIRYVDQRSNQMLMRQDIDDVLDEVLTFRRLAPQEYSALVVSDYDKGFLSIPQLVELSKSFKLSFLDTKKPIGEWVMNFSYIKINESEYDNRICSVSNAIVTLGDKGARYDGKLYHTEKPQVLQDVAGAGDSFLAGLVYNYLQTKDISSAIQYANKIAGIVVSKRGVSTI